ncbi:hypothetical protein K470DRAFT_270174 [Piedraia hortae CBS 480.64]|uniref:Uncharacterized protein n=1 Tax=Piedraia hortae CBS 480.64 TaxID=1314780 RepID=A0A6A7C1L9_9PEZI|nr:hypothetical protein K470DRAFT_270174 [Piedraia hortae CBS 480.64]
MSFRYDRFHFCSPIHGISLHHPPGRGNHGLKIVKIRLQVQGGGSRLLEILKIHLHVQEEWKKLAAGRRRVRATTVVHTHVYSSRCEDYDAPLFIGSNGSTKYILEPTISYLNAGGEHPSLKSSQIYTTLLAVGDTLPTITLSNDTLPTITLSNDTLYLTGITLFILMSLFLGTLIGQKIKPHDEIADMRMQIKPSQPKTKALSNQLDAEKRRGDSLTRRYNELRATMAEMEEVQRRENIKVLFGKIEDTIGRLREYVQDSYEEEEGGGG